MNFRKNLSKKKHRLIIQQKISSSILNNELLHRIPIKGHNTLIKKLNNVKVKAICKINCIYGRTQKNTNLNRHFIRLNLNKKLLKG
jgi:hypothetical protein